MQACEHGDAGDQTHTGVDTACQLELFDEVLTESEHTRAELPVGKDRLHRRNTRLEVVPIEPAEREPGDGGSQAGADRATLAALETALADARAAADDRPALVVLASRFGELGTQPAWPPAGALSLRQARDDWLRRLEASQKSESALVGYRVAIDDLLEWAEAIGRSVLEEATIVDYLRSYQQRAHPARATYYRRFLLLSKFLRWVSQREGVRDPFLDLEPPPKPRQERDWLTPEEFRRLLDAAGRPERNLPGLAERDRLTLLALVTTGLRRSELCALEWRDLELDGRKRSLLVRRGKGGKSRRQPLPAGVARELREAARRPATRADRPGLLRARRPTPAGDDSRRHHPPRGQARRNREARYRPHAAPHSRDLAPPGGRRHPPRRRVPRPRRPLDGRAVRTRGARGALRRGGSVGAARRSRERTGGVGRCPIDG